MEWKELLELTRRVSLVISYAVVVLDDSGRVSVGLRRANFATAGPDEAGKRSDEV